MWLHFLRTVCLAFAFGLSPKESPWWFLTSFGNCVPRLHVY
jgi:hypothetical protein